MTMNTNEVKKDLCDPPVQVRTFHLCAEARRPEVSAQLDEREDGGVVQHFDLLDRRDGKLVRPVRQIYRVVEVADV